ncbi:HlyD family efflux transporter periplasmic adaptor subunit [Legionella sp. 16cNR16C]|uniref:HlyD family secretion protein n=1 Tax=Legionella sp. 16cNR16C TaxID=2905656 RepID=UPI001E42F316|nr:HlyD family efflux transporter periplasmic adaptor subunit [Legionella sp. 16cNR16C]MCE3046444.1 HlyD family efflux transporter periplasmic adaptor subunit [Legionella sp. 16cNR16C]
MDKNDNPLSDIDPVPPSKTRQKRLLISLTSLFVLLAVAYLIYWWVDLRFFVYTDNAYVSGNIIPVTSQIAGNVMDVNVDNTELVKVNQPIIVLDPTDTWLALQAAKANLALTLRQTQQIYISDNGLQAIVKSRQSDLQKAEKDLKRREAVISLGGVSKEDLNHAREDYIAAQAALTTAQANWEANRSLTQNTTLIKHPQVLQAIATLRKAYLDYLRTSIRASATGIISKRSVQVGERISPGQVLMAIVPLEDIWVDANFKEKQLRDVRIGQPATVTADIYGSSVVYHGRVVGFSPGTGSAFALLPAQNATGNWIKVVQRLPVRIVLNPDEVRTHPLMIGLSMEVTVDTHKQKGQPMEVYKASYRTPIFDNMEKRAERLIKRIIQENIVQPNQAKPVNHLSQSNE